MKVVEEATVEVRVVVAQVDQQLRQLIVANLDFVRKVLGLLDQCDLLQYLLLGIGRDENFVEHQARVHGPETVSLVTQSSSFIELFPDILLATFESIAHTNAFTFLLHAESVSADVLVVWRHLDSGQIHKNNLGE